jgi:hypothetical protein
MAKEINITSVYEWFSSCKLFKYVIILLFICKTHVYTPHMHVFCFYLSTKYKWPFFGIQTFNTVFTRARHWTTGHYHELHSPPPPSHPPWLDHPKKHLVKIINYEAPHWVPQSSPGSCNCIPLRFKHPRNSSVSIAIDYGPGDWTSGVRFLAGAGKFSLRHRVQTGSGAHPASYPMGTRDLSLVVKRPDHEADH